MNDVTETELRILNVLWEGGEQTVREIAAVVFGGNVGKSEVGTIHSLIRRLEGKKLVRRSRRTHPHLFSAKVTSTELASSQVMSIAQTLTGGSVAPFVMHLISDGNLTQDEAQEIREMLQNYKGTGG